MYKGRCFNQKNVYKWAKLFNKKRKNVLDEDRPGKPTGVKTPTMITSVDDTIRSNKTVQVHARTEG